MSGEFILDEAVAGLRRIDADSVSLTVTSPPYDDLRTYKGKTSFNVHLVAAELERVTVAGGIVVWIVADQVISIPQTFEYMFVFSLGAPRTFRPITDKRNRSAGKRIGGTVRNRDGSMKPLGTGVIKEFGKRTNIWTCAAGYKQTAPDKQVHEHPAAFPLRLVADHIRTWSNPDETVLDCFGGSGQTAIAAEMLGRRWIHIDVTREYVELAQRRLANFRQRIPEYRDFCQIPGPPERAGNLHGITRRTSGG